MHLRPFIIPLFVPHMGCTHRCVFCNQRSITGHRGGRLSPQQVREGIARFLRFKGSRRSLVEVAFYGGNFLGLHTSYRNALLDEAQSFVKNGLVESIRFSTRPDTVTSTSLEFLDPYAVRVVEVGAQSMDDEILGLSGRGHSAEDTRRAVQLLKSYRFRVGVQIMPGLPGDTAESILETGRRVVALNPDFVRIYPTVVVKGTVLEKWYHSGQFKPLTLRDAVSMTKKLYLLFEANDISVIRMGLQASDSLLEPGSVVAGPFHPAFGHLVHSEIFLDLAAQEIQKQKGAFKHVRLKANPQDIPKLIGQKKGNITRLCGRFHLEKIDVIADPTVPENTVVGNNVCPDVDPTQVPK